MGKTVLSVQCLFSAYAEVFLDPCHFFAALMSFLCLRRGVSAYDANQGASRGFSLPTQRCFHGILKGVAHCFLFSAYAEVFPLTFSGTVTAAAFLCLRRGVSSLCRVVTRLARFSLPTQRCFPDMTSRGLRSGLFSAYAEVFLGL